MTRTFLCAPKELRAVRDAVSVPRDSPSGPDGKCNSNFERGEIWRSDGLLLGARSLFRLQG